jgi:purine-nucleoside phosphorylase
MDLFDQIQEAVAAVRERTEFAPLTGIILGTGLGRLVEDLEVVATIPYSELPHFAVSTVQSHAGKFVFGHLEGKPVVVMAGRLHWYEGWTMQQVTFPVRVMRALGCTRLIVTNVSGGINPHLQGGDLVVVRDHINLLPENPLRGPNDERLGPRFPDLVDTYDPAWRQQAISAAAQLGVRAMEGVYSALSGPNLETPAEYSMLRTLGSDCTGMSSVPEVLVARHSNMKVLMISLVSNVSFPPSRIVPTTLEDVINTAAQAEVGLRQLVRAVV